MRPLTPSERLAKLSQRRSVGAPMFRAVDLTPSVSLQSVEPRLVAAAARRAFGGPAVTLPVVEAPVEPKNPAVTLAHLGELARKIEEVLFPVAQMHMQLRNKLKAFIYWDTIWPEWAHDNEQSGKGGQHRALEVIAGSMVGHPDWPMPEWYEAKKQLDELLSSVDALEASAATVAVSLSKQLKNSVLANANDLPADVKALANDIVNEINDYSDKYDIPCGNAYVRDPNLAKLGRSKPNPKVSSTVQCLYSQFAQTSLEGAILDARTLQKMVSSL